MNENTTTNQDSRFNQALRFASLGIRVIPLKPNTKEPLLIDWPHKASADPIQIGQWFEQYPDCNYGLLMGEGFAVLDIDKKNGKDGFTSLEQIVTDNTAANTLTVITPNEGLHLYFQCQNDLPSRHGFLEGLDFQASATYVLGPASCIGGAEYQVIGNSANIATIPQWLLNTVDRKVHIPKPTLITNRTASAFKANEHGELGQLLAVIDPDLPYREWIEAIFAGLNIFGTSEEIIATLWDWSSSGNKFDQEAFDKVIASHDPTHEQQVGLPRLKEVACLYPLCDNWLPYNEQAIELEQKVLTSAIDMLEMHGNKPGERHLDGIRAIVRAMVHGLYEADAKFRKAFPLETGMGKTTCVIALAQEIQHTDKSLLITAERIEQLIEMREQMIQAGVDASKLGIFHSSQHKYPHCPSINIDQLGHVQFLLSAHNRVKSDSMHFIAERLMAYQNRKRDLVIWDESLITTTAYAQERGAVRKAINGWLIDYEEKRQHGRHSKGYEHLYVEFSEFLTSADELLNPTNPEAIIKLPRLDHDANEYSKIINTWGVANAPEKSILKSLVSYSLGGEIRLVKTKDGHALVQFFQTVDDVFDRMIILDASSHIRDLVSYDASVSIYPMSVSKDYSLVTVKHLDIRSSKSSFTEFPTHLENYLGELDQILANDIPKNEPFLIFCHLELKEQIHQWRQARYPLREIAILHWGEHRASNRYSHIKYMATVGVLYRSTKDIAAEIIGQTRSLHYPLIDSDIQQTINSEQADLLYQGISRGNSRRTQEGKAGEQTIYLFHPERDIQKLMSLLCRVMPNVQWQEYEPRVLQKPMRANAEKYENLGFQLLDFMTHIPPAKDKVSIQSIRKTVAPDIDTNSSTWRNALSGMEFLMVGWERKGQSYLRVTD